MLLRWARLNRSLQRTTAVHDGEACVGAAAAQGTLELDAVADMPSQPAHVDAAAPTDMSDQLTAVPGANTSGGLLHEATPPMVLPLHSKTLQHDLSTTTAIKVNSQSTEHAPTFNATAPELDDLRWWFEVSAHSSRIHVHAAADGSQPLGLNVPLEALLDGGGGLTDSVVNALIARCVDQMRGCFGWPAVCIGGQHVTSPKSSVMGCLHRQQGDESVTMTAAGVLAINPATPIPCLQAALGAARLFVAEWVELRAVHQHKLSGALLQPPLQDAVAALQVAEGKDGSLGVGLQRYGQTGAMLKPPPDGATVHQVTVHYPWYANLLIDSLPIC